MTVRMTQDKLDAIALGDVSGQVIHPIFIQLAHLLGSVFHHHGAEHPDKQRELIELASVREIIRTQQDITLTPTAALQAQNLVSFYYMYSRDFAGAQSAIQESKQTISRYNMHITIPESALHESRPSSRAGERVYATPLTAADEEDEKRCILMHMWFRDKAADLMSGSKFLVAEHLDDEIALWAVSVLDIPIAVWSLTSYLVFRRLSRFLTVAIPS